MSCVLPYMYISTLHWCVYVLMVNDLAHSFLFLVKFHLRVTQSNIDSRQFEASASYRRDQNSSRIRELPEQRWLTHVHYLRMHM